MKKLSGKGVFKVYFSRYSQNTFTSGAAASAGSKLKRSKPNLNKENNLFENNAKINKFQKDNVTRGARGGVKERQVGNMERSGVEFGSYMDKVLDEDDDVDDGKFWDSEKLDLDEKSGKVATASTSTEVQSIESFNISPQIVNSLKANNITKLFPVQLETLKALKGSGDDVSLSNSKDLIVRSKTGSGKTLAFGIPLLETLLRNKTTGNLGDGKKTGRPRAIVLVPTRELAIQVYGELNKYCSMAATDTETTSLKGAIVYGGVAYNQQIAQLKNCDFVVGTPGRVIDLLERRNVDMSEIKVAVLDEADEMLKVGFKEDIDLIFSKMPAKDERQTFLFSATFNKEVQRIASEYMRKIRTHINLVQDSDGRIPAEIDMIAMVTSSNQRRKALANIIALNCSHSKTPEGETDESPRVLVFANSRALCEELVNCEELSKTGVNCAALHGDMSQSLREQALLGFRKGIIKCIIATDVAARGLDIPKVDMVVHFDIPREIRGDSFVHRTGRTGRAGRKGKNILLYDHRDKEDLEILENKTQRKFIRQAAPNSSEVMLQTLPRIETAISVLLKNKPYESVLPFTDAANRIISEVAKGEENVVSKDKVVDIVSAALCFATGFGEQGNEPSFSALSGLPHFITFEAKVSEKLRSKLMKLNVKKGSIIRKDVSEVANEFDKDLQNKLGTKKDKPVLRNLHVLKTLDGLVFDVPSDIGQRLIEKSIDEICPVENILPEVLSFSDMNKSSNSRGRSDRSRPSISDNARNKRGRSTRGSVRSSR